MSVWPSEAAEKNPVLVLTLDMAVPMHLHEIRAWSFDARLAEARRCADAVAAHGDVLQFGGNRKGDTAEAFNAFARGLAVAAYQPGGVDFADRHWCVWRHPSCPTGNEGTEAEARGPDNDAAQRRRRTVTVRAEELLG